METPKKSHFIAVQVITLARIPLAGVFTVLMLMTQPGQQTELPLVTLLVGTLILICIEVTDFYDGRIARRYGVVTEWGAMLDPYSDSVSRILVYAALSWASLCLFFVPLVMAMRDVTVAYCRIIMAKHGKSVSANWSGKIKAGIQAVGAVVLLWGPLYWGWIGEWILPAGCAFLALATLASMIEYIKGAVNAVTSAQDGNDDPPISSLSA